MNPISAISWFWKALRGHSVTFAVLLAFALLGFSVIHWLKEGLYAVGTPWLVVFIIPSVLVGVLAKKERVWIPDEPRRKFWARSIICGAVLLAVVSSLLKPETPQVRPTNNTRVNSSNGEVSGSEPAPVPGKPVRPRGPSGK